MTVETLDPAIAEYAKRWNVPADEVRTYINGKLYWWRESTLEHPKTFELRYQGNGYFTFMRQGHELKDYRRNGRDSDFVAVSHWLTQQGYENSIELDSHPHFPEDKIKIHDDKMLMWFLLKYREAIIFPPRVNEFYD